MVGIGLGHNDISFRNCQSHLVSSPSFSKTINFDSIVERAMQVCLEDFQDRFAPPGVKMYLLVYFDSEKSAIQFASLYPSIIGEYFFYLKAYSLVFFKYPLLVVRQSNDRHYDY